MPRRRLLLDVFLKGNGVGGYRLYEGKFLIGEYKSLAPALAALTSLAREVNGIIDKAMAKRRKRRRA